MTTAVLPRRAASTAYVQPQARNARIRQPPARQNKVDATDELTTGGKTTCPRPSILVCGVHVLDGYETLDDVFRENAHTDARDARSLHASQPKLSIFSSHCQGDVHTGLGQRGQGSQTVTSFFQQKHPCLTTVYVAYVPSGLLCLDNRKRETTSRYSKKKKQHCCGAVDTSSRAVACALTSKPQLLLLLHSTRVLTSTVKNLEKPQLLLIDRGGHLLSNDLLLSSSALLLWRSSSHSDDVWSPVASDVAASAQQRNRIACLQKPTTHTPWNERTEEDNCDTKAPVSVLRRHTPWNVGVVVRGLPPLCRSSRQSDS